tara:strand:+ start:1028 stop:1486 length:459 start_codon:yes stop_codon:yes gene_type:complete
MGYLVKSTIDGTSVTGTTITISDSKLIVANSLTVGDILEVNYGWSKLVAPFNLFVRIYINTSNSLTGATQLALYNTAVGITPGIGGRIFYIKSATNTDSSIVTSSQINPDAVVTANSSLNIDWTVSQYLIIALSNSGPGCNSFSTFLLGLKR